MRTRLLLVKPGNASPSCYQNWRGIPGNSFWCIIGKQHTVARPLAVFVNHWLETNRKWRSCLVPLSSAPHSLQINYLEKLSQQSTTTSWKEEWHGYLHTLMSLLPALGMGPTARERLVKLDPTPPTTDQATPDRSRPTIDPTARLDQVGKWQWLSGFLGSVIGKHGPL